MDFNGKTALVTGAAQGIGRATALELARMGANVALIDICYEGVSATAEKIKSDYGRDAIAYECDISDEVRVYACAKDILAHFGKVDILVNNAAVFRAYKPFLDTPTEDWRRYFDINVMGTVYVTKAILPTMVERGYGRIINVASVAGIYGLANMAQYSATKGAVIAFSKSLAKEVCRSGVTVNAVCPGSVSPGENPDIDHTVETNLTHMGRTGSDRENANLICFLASDLSTYLTGESIEIHGSRKLI